MDLYLKENPVRDQSYQFALDIVRLCRWLMDEQREYVLSKQLLRSGTSIGANVEESQQGQSTNDFISKLSISLKEAYETRYWIRILRDSAFVESDISNKLLEKLSSIINLLVSIIKSSKAKTV